MKRVFVLCAVIAIGSPVYGMQKFSKKTEKSQKKLRCEQLEKDILNYLANMIPVISGGFDKIDELNPFEVKPKNIAFMKKMPKFFSGLKARCLAVNDRDKKFFSEGPWGLIQQVKNKDSEVNKLIDRMQGNLSKIFPGQSSSGI